MDATGGDPGGVCVTKSALNVRFAICIHSSRVLRKVVHVDFTMSPLSTTAYDENKKVMRSSRRSFFTSESSVH